MKKYVFVWRRLLSSSVSLFSLSASSNGESWRATTAAFNALDNQFPFPACNYLEILLPSANEVWGKVMFLHLSVSHSVHSGHQSGRYASYRNAYLSYRLLALAKSRDFVLSFVMLSNIGIVSVCYVSVFPDSNLIFETFLYLEFSGEMIICAWKADGHRKRTHFPLAFSSAPKSHPKLCSPSRAKLLFHHRVFLDYPQKKVAKSL